VQEKKAALGFIPMGACKATPHRDTIKNQPLCFILEAARMGKRDFYLSADDEKSFTSWLSFINLTITRRVKVLSLVVAQFLSLLYRFDIDFSSL
jgi:hypothetical protein